MENSNFGMRMDYVEYDIGGECHESCTLYQDPCYDYEEKLIYPAGEGIYEGFYVGEALGGTCAISFDPLDSRSIEKALDTVKKYFGKFLHVLVSDQRAREGSDDGEIILENAIVIGKFSL